MNEKAQRYPLAWPMNWKRTPPHERRRADFRRTVKEAAGEEIVNGVRRVKINKRSAPATIASALDRLDGELRRLGSSEEILSSNVPVGVRGMPLSVSAEPRDPGVAVYIVLKKKDLVFACDKWDRVADNIIAIAQHLDALRRIDRYGVGKLEQAFHGYAALPPAAEDWREILGVGEYATIEQVDAAFLEKMREAHPDAGGTHEEAARLTAARDFARRVLGG